MSGGVGGSHCTPASVAYLQGSVKEESSTAMLYQAALGGFPFTAIKQSSLKQLPIALGACLSPTSPLWEGVWLKGMSSEIKGPVLPK